MHIMKCQQKMSYSSEQKYKSYSLSNRSRKKYEVRRILINSKHTFKWYSYNLYTFALLIVALEEKQGG